MIQKSIDPRRKNVTCLVVFIHIKDSANVTQKESGNWKKFNPYRAVFLASLKFFTCTSEVHLGLPCHDIPLVKIFLNALTGMDCAVHTA